MQNQRFSGLFIFFLLCGACARPHVEKPHIEAPRLHQRPTGFWENKKSVVQVLHIYTLATDKNGLPFVDKEGKTTTQDMTEMGTGAVVDINGLVLTNNHVIVPELTGFETLAPDGMDLYEVCEVKKGTQDCALAAVFAADPVHDLAYVQTARHFSRAISFADAYQLLPGDDIYLWGNVGKILPPSPFFGHYVETLGEPYFQDTDNLPPQLAGLLPLLMTDINVSFGTSGAPVFNEEGKCVGTVVAIPDEEYLGSRSLPYVIPLTTVNKFRKEHPWTPPKD